MGKYLVTEKERNLVGYPPFPSKRKEYGVFIMHPFLHV
jgi:hypothetical protein